MAKKERVQISLASDEIEQLDFVATRLGYSRAAIISGIVSESLPVLHAMCKASVKRKRKEKDSDTVKRVRGVSADLLGDSLRDLLK